MAHKTNEQQQKIIVMLEEEGRDHFKDDNIVCMNLCLVCVPCYIIVLR